MPQALSLVTRALRTAGVLASGETPTADELQDALATLRAMLAQWEHRGVVIGAPNTITASTDLPLAAREELCAVQMLAVMLAPEYGRTPSPVLVAAAESGFRGIQAERVARPVVDLRG